MENFTDLFGADDLSGLEGLGDFGNAFASTENRQPGNLGDGVGVGGQPQGPSSIPGAIPSGQYGQHPQQQYHPQAAAQQKAGYGAQEHFNQYRGMAPGPSPNQQYPYGAGTAAGHSPSGYPAGPSTDHRSMPPGARMPGTYPSPNHQVMGGQAGYPGSYGQQGQQQQMYGRQMMGQQQGAWGGGAQQGTSYSHSQQPGNAMNPQYGPGGAVASNGPPSGQGLPPNFRPQHNAYPPGSGGGPGSDMNIQQHRMASQYPPASNTSGGFPPSRMPPGSVPGSQPNYPNAPQSMYGGPQNQMSRNSQMQSGAGQGQMATSTSTASAQMSNFHHQGYPGARPGHPSSANLNQQQQFSSSMPPDFPRHSVPTNQQNSSQQNRMPSMPPANAQQQAKHGRAHPIPHQTGGQPTPRMSSPMPPNQQQPSGGHMQQQQSNINSVGPQRMMGPQPPTGPMYRAPYSSPQHPGSQSSISPAAGMSPRAMSPAQSSSPVPSKTPNSIMGGQTGLPPNTQQGNASSSLQQLEQMVMPGSKEANLQQQQLHNSSQAASQATSPMPPNPSQSP